MLNKEHDEGASLSLPVPEGTSSGDPVLIGDQGLIGTAATDRDSDGNATVELAPSPVYRQSVLGEDKEEEGLAIEIGDKVFLDEGVLNGDSENGTFYGWALDAVVSEATTTIRVKLAHP